MVGGLTIERAFYYRDPPTLEQTFELRTRMRAPHRTRKEASPMFVPRTRSADMAVAVDGRSGRPTGIQAGGELFAITKLERIRDETAAYPPEVGPRTVFVVRSHGLRYRLVHLLDAHRWTIEELPADASGLTRAA
jgi:hypothetical protein